MAEFDSWYLDNLVCPVDRLPLEFDGQYLRSRSGRSYPVLEGVPVMLLPDKQQTMGIARASIERARGRSEVIDRRAPELYLESIGISDWEKDRAAELAREHLGHIDPAVSVMLGGTSGNAYAHLIGNPALGEYPIPRIGLPPSNGRQLLDIGCNWGRWSIAATRIGYSVVGIDPSLGAIMAARRVAQDLGLGVKHVVGDGRWLPFKDRSFDNVYSYSVLQHFAKEDARKTIAQIGRVLRSGGIAKIQMANRVGLRSFMHQYRRRFREPADFEVRYWPVSELRRTYTELIGSTTITTDCYFGLGWQWADWSYMRPLHRPILIASEALKRLSVLLPPMCEFADSVFCTSVARGT